MADDDPSLAGDAGLDRCRAIEERAFNAWPAFETRLADGWILRFADGYTKRANSINAWRPARDIGSLVDATAHLYRDRGLPVIVRLTPLAGAGSDQALAARGFRRLDETIVMTRQCRPETGLGAAAGFAVATTPTDAWLQGFATANAIAEDRRSIHDRLVRGVQGPVAFGSSSRDGRAVAWGLAAIERGMVGIFDVATDPAMRRRGVGREVVEGLLHWARDHGARTAYLQVLATNAAALSLYQSLHFQEFYRYHYRLEPLLG